jgi:hypothetical protein
MNEFVIYLLTIVGVAAGIWVAVAWRKRARRPDPGAVLRTTQYLDELTGEELVAATVPLFSKLIQLVGYRDARSLWYGTVKAFPRELRMTLDPTERKRKK